MSNELLVAVLTLAVDVSILVLLVGWKRHDLGRDGVRTNAFGEPAS